MLLDLDGTLVLTSALEPLRRRRAWQQCYAAFPSTTVPPGTHEFLDRARAIGDVGVITSSPWPYAERPLAHHHLRVPVLVAYYDVPHRKPHPSPVLRAAEQLGLPPARCVCIGDTEDDLLAAVAAGAVPIGLSWDGSVAWPAGIRPAAAICRSWTRVLVRLGDVITR